MEDGEECDCGSNDAAECELADPCCKPGNCTLIEGAECRLPISLPSICCFNSWPGPLSPVASICCTEGCKPKNSSVVCLVGDECTASQTCKYPLYVPNVFGNKITCCNLDYCLTGQSAECPEIEFKNGIFCDNYMSTCINGSCIGNHRPLCNQLP